MARTAAYKFSRPSASWRRGARLRLLVCLATWTFSVPGVLVPAATPAVAAESSGRRPSAKAATGATAAKASKATKVRRATKTKGGKALRSAERRRSKGKGSAARGGKRPGKRAGASPSGAGGWELGLEDLFRALLALVTLALLWRERQFGAGRGEGAVAASTGFTPYAAQPVQLERSPGIDPATIRQEHTMAPIGLGSLENMPVLRLDEDDPRRVAAEIELLTSDTGGLKVKNGATPAARRPVLALPPELAEHFSGGAGETMLWQGPFAVGDVSGYVAVTSRRLLAVHRRRHLRLLPPGIATELRRHQHDVMQLTAAESGRGRYPSLLWIAAATLLWFPLGSIVACLALGCYFAVTRSELHVSSGDAVRRYPLPPLEQRSAIAALAHAKRADSAPERAGTPPHPNVGGQPRAVG